MSYFAIKRMNVKITILVVLCAVLAGCGKVDNNDTQKSEYARLLDAGIYYFSSKTYIDHGVSKKVYSYYVDKAGLMDNYIFYWNGLNKSWSNAFPYTIDGEDENYTYYLTSTGWMPNISINSVFDSNGLETSTRNSTGTQFTKLSTISDVSGQAIDNYLKSSNSSDLIIPLNLSRTVFPAGSQAISYKYKELTGYYYISGYTYLDTNGLTTDSRTIRYNGTEIKSLNELTQTFVESQPSSFYLYFFDDNRSLIFYFAPGNTISVYERIKDATTGNYTSTKVGTGNWEDVVVFNQTLRKVSVSDSFRTQFGITDGSDPIFVVKGGVVKMGFYVKPGLEWNSSKNDFNKTAFDHVLENFDKSTAKLLLKSTLQFYNDPASLVPEDIENRSASGK